MNIRTNLPKPQGYTPNQMNASFNQAMASAHQAADPRYSLKELDKAGMSRGAGQQYLGGIHAANRLADGVAAAYSQNLQDQATNADLSIDPTAESVGLNVGGIAQQVQYANALAALQRQRQAMSGNALGGLLGGNLDSFLGF